MPDVPHRHVQLLRDTDCLPSLRLFHRMAEWEAIGGEDYLRRQVNQVCGVAPEVAAIIDVLCDVPVRQQIHEFARRTGRRYDAARKAWHKYAPMAEQQLVARERLGRTVE